MVIVCSLVYGLPQNDLLKVKQYSKGDVRDVSRLVVVTLAGLSIKNESFFSFTASIRRK